MLIAQLEFFPNMQNTVDILAKYPVIFLITIHRLLYSYDERELLVNSIPKEYYEHIPMHIIKMLVRFLIHNSLKHIIQGHSEIIEDQYGLDYEQQQEIKKYKWIN